MLYEVITITADIRHNIYALIDKDLEEITKRNRGG